MKASDFRIGNLVLEGFDKEVYIVGWNDIANMWQFPALSMYPIPLTEEWLEKSGFEKGEDCDYEKDGFKLWSYGEGKAGFYHINSELILYFDNVHDIQNGWKVIMEEELEIREVA